MNKHDDYRGWQITEIQHHGKPHFIARRYGVNMNTRTLEGIKIMIDAKITTNQADRNA